MVHIWLGIPLLFGLMGWAHGGLDQYQDLGEYAATAPRMERQGLIKKADLRGERHVLIADDERIAITCSVPPNSECMKYITPLRATVRYFKYRGQNVIIDLVSEGGSHIIVEDERVKRLLIVMKYYKDDSTLDAILWMIFFSFYLVIPFIIGIPIIRWIGRRNMNKKGKS